MILCSVHDGDIAPMITALDVLNDPDPLPFTYIAHARKWRKSQVSPMGGRIILEVLSCKANTERSEEERSEERSRSQEKSSLDNKFVRLNINDGITPLPSCASGPGQTCPLTHFITLTAQRGLEIGDFKTLCNLPNTATAGISFLKQ
jgi:acid phosphatase